MQEDTAPTESAEITRRTFLGYVAAATSAFIGVAVGVPIVGYVASPLRAKGAGKWVSLGKVKDFAKQVPQAAPFNITQQDGWVQESETRTCWVVPGEDGQFTVFNGHCTHLGCAYSWKTDGPDAGKFVCPCHEGKYDRKGNVLSGPPPRPLDRLQTKVENGELLVLYQDFRLGVEQKVPV